MFAIGVLGLDLNNVTNKQFFTVNMIKTSNTINGNVK
jgi:hypothetical protein